MNRKLSVFVVLVLILTLLTLAGCDAAPSGSTSGNGLLLPMSTDASASNVCATCAQETVAAIQTQAQNGMDAQAAATAEVMRANAQATLDSVGATLSAAQTQEQTNANIIAAEVAATAEINRANAQATLVAAGSTQNAAMTQDAIRQTQAQGDIQVTADLATQNAVGTLTQQSINVMAAGTQTAVVDRIATQTQSALALSQSATQQARSRMARDQDQIAFMGMWCLLFSIPILAGLGIGIFLRLLKNRETQRRNNLQPVTPEPASETIPPIIGQHQPLSGSSPANNQYPPFGAKDNVNSWLDEVKSKLLAENKDNNDDKPGI